MIQVRVKGEPWVVRVESPHDVHIEGPGVDEYGSLSRQGTLEDFQDVPDDVLDALEAHIKHSARKIELRNPSKAGSVFAKMLSAAKATDVELAAWMEANRGGLIEVIQEKIDSQKDDGPLPQRIGAPSLEYIRATTPTPSEEVDTKRRLLRERLYAALEEIKGTWNDNEKLQREAKRDDFALMYVGKDLVKLVDEAEEDVRILRAESPPPTKTPTSNW